MACGVQARVQPHQLHGAPDHGDEREDRPQEEAELVGDAAALSGQRGGARERRPHRERDEDHRAQHERDNEPRPVAVCEVARGHDQIVFPLQRPFFFQGR